ncbi:unnamed protein product [Linum trigynum]|uniref:Uncharacterized protein n=1 Tax=Linum trigynum TaxID=586398 RepID=A0AAV2CTP8_9ROSI
MASSALNFVTVNPKLQQSPKPTPPSHRFTTARRFLSSLRPIKASIFEKSPLSSIPVTQAKRAEEAEVDVESVEPEGTAEDNFSRADNFTDLSNGDILEYESDSEYDF